MSPLLSLESVSKGFWRGQRPVDVLTDVSLTLDAGELAGVWGPRSAGKTTLLELIAGLQDPDAGRVLFDGRDLATMTDRERSTLLHREIGIAPRNGPASRDLPIDRWISLALLDRAGWRDGLRRAHQALERVGAADVARAAWDDLSDGERTLTSIARAIVREPRLLLVDDPNAGLGLLERGEIATLLRSVAHDAGVSVLVTAADVSEIQGTRTIWSLAGGRLVGRPASRRADATVVDMAARRASGLG
ncbi:MAG: ATP-binding cassette domain-containing protein [Patulibacter sp.]